MTLDEKRDLIEVLLCSGFSVSTDRAAKYLGATDRIREFAADSWSAIYREHLVGEHIEICVEAAYRLIESSPVLRREWFGTR